MTGWRGGVEGDGEFRKEAGIDVTKDDGRCRPSTGRDGCAGSGADE